MSTKYYLLMVPCEDDWYGDSLATDQFFTEEQKNEIIEETIKKYGSERELYQWFKDKTGRDEDVFFTEVTLYDGNASVI